MAKIFKENKNIWMLAGATLCAYAVYTTAKYFHKRRNAEKEAKQRHEQLHAVVREAENKWNEVRKSRKKFYKNAEEKRKYLSNIKEKIERGELDKDVFVEKYLNEDLFPTFNEE